LLRGKATRIDMASREKGKATRMKKTVHDPLRTALVMRRGDGNRGVDMGCKKEDL